MKSKVLLAAISLFAFSNSFSQERALSFSWEKVGPDNVVSKSSSILVSTTDAESKTLILGSESNGLYRSTNKGANWQKVDVSGMSRFVSGLHQTADGKIYASTGVVPNYTYTDVPYSYDKIGNGIWVSGDGGSTYSQLSNTAPTSSSTSDFWSSINKVNSDPSNASKLYVGTNFGFMMSTDAGSNWADPIGLTLPVTDIDAGNGGQLIVSYLSGNAQVSVDGGSTFVNVIGTNTGQIPSTDIIKTEFAISKADNNIVYACGIKANGFIGGIYKSTDKGLNWSLLTPGSTYFAEALLGGGVANSLFEVIPGETTSLVLAGTNFFTYSTNDGWTKRLSAGYGGFTSMAWDSKNVNNFYATTNSGVWRTYGGAYNISSVQSINAGIESPDISSITYSSQYIPLAPAKVYLKFSPKKDTTYSFTITQRVNGTTYTNDISYKSIANTGNEAEIKTNILNQLKSAVNAGTLAVTIDTSAKIAGELKILISAWKNNPDFIISNNKKFIVDMHDVVYPSSQPTLFVSTQFAGAYYLEKLGAYNKSGYSLNTSSTTSGILAGIQRPIFDAGIFGELSKSADLGANWSGGENIFSELLSSLVDNYAGTSNFSNTKTPAAYSEKQNADSTFTQRLALASNADMSTASTPSGVPSKPSVWISKDPLNIDAAPSWLRVADNYTSKPDKFSGNPENLQFTSNQDYLFVTSNDGTNSYLYRIYIPNQLISDSSLAAYNNASNIDGSTGLHIKTLDQMDSLFTQIRSAKSLVKVNKIANFGTRTITGIYTDPNDQSRLLVSLGGYGFTNYLYLTGNADSCSSANDMSNFSSVQGNLSGTPVNSALIDALNNNIAVIATNDGVFYTEDLLEPSGNCNWTNDNTFPAKVATCLTQVTNDYLTAGDKGNIYIGTLGKGAYVSKASTRVSTKNITKLSGIKVFPNPSKGTFTFNSEKSFNQIIVRNITGQTVFNKNLNALESTSTINLELPDGVYIYEILNNSNRIGSGKVLINK